jgi:hypothetical protein
MVAKRRKSAARGKPIVRRKPGNESLESKYKRCVLKVMAKGNNKYNAYAICTKSIYGSRGLHRDKRIEVIGPSMRSASFPQIRNVAKDLGVRLRSKRPTKKQYVAAIERRIKRGTVSKNRVARALLN